MSVFLSVFVFLSVCVSVCVFLYVSVSLCVFLCVREEDVHDCHGHVSAFLVTSSEFARESLASQFCSPTALTLVSLSLSLFMSFLFLFQGI